MNIKQFDIILVDLGSNIGSEQNGIRPCVVVSNNACNEFSDVLNIVPLTSKEDDCKWHMRLFPNSFNNLTCISYCLPEQIRCISRDRVVSDNYGILTYMQTRKLNDDLRLQLGL